MPFAIEHQRGVALVRGRAGAALVALCLLAACPAAGDQARTAKAGDLIQAAARAMEWGDRYASVTNVRYRATVGDDTRESLIGTDSVVKRYCDGDRLHVIIDFVGHLSRGGAFIARASRRETVYAGNTRTYWWYPIDRPVSGSAQLARSVKRVSAMRLIDQSDSGAGCFLDGCVDGVGSIVDIASGGEVSPAVGQANVNGTACDVVESRLPSGRAVLWIAPSLGKNVIKYLLEETTDGTGPMRAEFEATGFQNMNGRVVIRSGKSTRTWVNPGDRTKWQETVEAERVKLDLHPEFREPKLFTTEDVPDGIRVLLDDMPNVGVDFVWYHGAPVAKVDADLFGDLGTSVRKTEAGQESKVVLIATKLGSGATAANGGSQVMELWITLCSSAALAVALLAGIVIWRRDVRRVRHGE